MRSAYNLTNNQAINHAATGQSFENSTTSDKNVARNKGY